jgi:3-phosphoshikimate 1-carboxyvinyltransferase
MLDCIKRLNIGVEVQRDQCNVDPQQIDWHSDVELDLRMSGLSLRLLLAFAALRPGKTRFVGDESLRLRPQKDLIDALRNLDCIVESSDDTLPISVRGNPRGGTVNLNTSISSQYLTALLVAGPRFEEGLNIKLSGQRVSSSYIDITINEMRRRGYVPKQQDQGYEVPPGNYDEGETRIEGDASAATYFAALATLHGSRVTLENLGSESRQGDCRFLGVCSDLGARLSQTRDSTTIEGNGALRGLGTVDMVQMPDAALTMMALAPYLPTSTTITGLASLPFKECDRIACPSSELRKAGVVVHETSDRVQINPSVPSATRFETYRDHRMAMAFAVLASKVQNCSIVDPDCVNKTYPRFWNDFDAIYTQGLSASEC